MTDYYVLESQFNCDCNEAIAMFTEAVAEYNIRCKEIELAQMEHKILAESADYLYEDADEQAETKEKGAIGKFFEAIANFVKNIIEKIKNFFTGKKVDDRIKNAQEQVKNDPELAGQKVEVFDFNAMTNSQKKHFEKIKPLLEKYQAGDEMTASEIKKLQKFFNDDYAKISAKKVVLPIGAALTALAGAAVYLKTSGNNMSSIVGTVKNKIGGAADTIKNKKMNMDADRKIKSADKNAAEAMQVYQQEIKLIGSKNTELLDKINEQIAAIEAKIKKVNGRDADIAAKANYGSNAVVKKGAQIIQAGTERYNRNARGKLEDKKAELVAQKERIESGTQSEINAAYNKKKSEHDQQVNDIKSKRDAMNAEYNARKKERSEEQDKINKGNAERAAQFKSSVTGTVNKAKGGIDNLKNRVFGNKKKDDKSED